VKLKLLGNRIHIKPLSQAMVSPGGLHMVERYVNNKQVLYSVLAVGPGRKLKNETRVPVEVKPDDRVIAHSFSGTQHTFEDGSKIIDANEVMMIV